MFQPEFQKFWQQEPFVVVDAGARGGAQPPWSQLPLAARRMIYCEPDPEAQAVQNSQDIWVPAGLWSTAGEVTLHVGRDASTSSVPPPDISALKRFAERHWLTRETEQTVTVPVTTLDEEVRQRGLTCDVIKLDTHGAELPILTGARHSLAASVFCVVVEAWTWPVHRGQGLLDEVLALLRAHQFEVHDITVAARWQLAAATRRGIADRGQVVGVDVMLFRELKPWLAAERRSTRAVLRAAAVADVYGSTGLALMLLDAAAPAPEITLAQRSLAKRPKAQSWWQRLISHAGRQQRVEPYARLHY